MLRIERTDVGGLTEMAVVNSHFIRGRSIG